MSTDSSTPATPPALWHGWARRGTRGRWQRVATAATDALALEMVRRLTAGWPHTDVAILPAGKDPNETRC